MAHDVFISYSPEQPAAQRHRALAAEAPGITEVVPRIDVQQSWNTAEPIPSGEATTPQKEKTMPARASHTGSVSRRDVVKGAAALAAGAALGSHLAPGRALAQAPKRGGVVTVRAWDPPHFDPHLTISYKTHIAYSFTHSRLLKYKAGPSVAPGVFPIEGDIAESWTQPNETTYVFKLRPGVRWHAKPPVNGREVTADDVVYSVERFRTVKGNANAYMLSSLDKVEALDKYTVRFTLKEPFVWFLDMIANPHAVAIIARECVDKFGDLKKPEATVGTGPWMLDSYRPNLGMTMVRHPGYFMAGLPYIDRVELVVDEDNASRMATFLSGKYDLGWEFMGIINRVDWVNIKDTLKQKRPRLQTVDFTTPVMSHISMRTDKAPFSDVRVRRAMSMAIDRKAIIDAVYEGVGVDQPGDTRRPQGVVGPDGGARRGRAVLPVRSCRREEAPRRGGLSQGLPRDDGLHDLRLHRPGGHRASS